MSKRALTEVDIYPVGLLADLGQFVHCPNRRTARRTLRRSVTTISRYVAAGRWDELRNYLNGYLAEPNPFPAGLTRCGSGWTRGRAFRDLQRRTARAALTSRQEA